MPTSMFTQAYAALVNVLIETRKEAHLSQTELGQRLGKGQKFISVIETGVRRVDLIEFCALAQAMGCKPEVLFARVVKVLPEKLEI